MSSYLVKKNLTISSGEHNSNTYYAGDVVSDTELPDHVKEKIKEGVSWYTQSYEILSDKEAELYRKKATSVEGKRSAPNGEIVDPPWDDYVGLHPREVVDRMKTLSYKDAETVRQYERAGLNRPDIIDYVTPSEREPWHEYDNWSVRDIIEKLDIIDTQTVQDVIVYEMNHKNRAAIITYEPEEDTEISQSSVIPSPSEEKDTYSESQLSGVGASTSAESQA